MLNVGFIFFCLAVVCLSAVCMTLSRRVSLMEKAFRVAAERLEGEEYV